MSEEQHDIQALTSQSMTCISSQIAPLFPRRLVEGMYKTCAKWAKQSFYAAPRCR